MKLSKIFVLSVVGVMLLCSVASAMLPRGVIETPYFEISREYAKNPIKTHKEWVNKKGVALYGKVKELGVDQNGNAVVICVGRDEGEKYDTVAYFFYFPEGEIPDAVMSLEEGRYEAFGGPVFNIRVDKNNSRTLFIDVGPAIMF